MFCSQCGEPNPDHAAYCKKCGAQIENPFKPGSAIPRSPQISGQLPEVQNYLVPAILVTVCCCPLFGVVSIVYGAQVGSKLTSGDYQGALQASKNARMWMLIGLVLGGIAVFFQLIAFLIEIGPNLK